jgi:high-affinity iron transporter
MGFGNVTFVVWRESVEALLVIGILGAWLARNDIDRRGARYLWGGVTAGLLLAVALGAALIVFGETIPDNAQQIYQTVAVLIASVLIVQMVFWMRRHARTLKRELETALQRASEQSRWWSVFILSMIAVAREGSETVIFLSGTLAAARATSLIGPLVAAGAGFLLAIATYYLLQVGSRILSWRVFFSITEAMLLLLAAALLMTATDNLIDLGILPALSGRLWDSSAILRDGGPVGGLIGSLTGYRARPNLLELLVYVTYWAGIYWFLLSDQPRTKTA